MIVHQFYDKGLAHASYAILSEGKMAVIDPARDAKPYYDFAKGHNAQIVAVIETHLHADFISSHVEIAKQTGAKIYVSNIAEVEYTHQTFDDGNTIILGKITLLAINTPGHSPDSISILLKDEHNQPYAIFTGDTLFAGDVGRPDLRESTIDTKERLAHVLYYSLHSRILQLPNDTLVYPAHGPGSLCGKNLGPDLFTTIGKEKNTSSLLQLSDENNFVEKLLQDQPFVPKYFSYDVLLNRKGAESAAVTIPQLQAAYVVEANDLVIDVRPKEQFKAGHVKGVINIPVDKNFETWLGTIVAPDEKFYIMGSTIVEAEEAVYKASKIGYETSVQGIAEVKSSDEKSISIDLEDFKNHKDKYTIIDIRNSYEIPAKIFREAILIPLPELRDRVEEIPVTKPVVVHCAGGTRSAIGASILQKYITAPVFDLGEAIKNFVN